MSLADDLKNLDPNNPGLWPAPVQLAVCVLVVVVILAGGYFLHFKNQRITLGQQEQQEVSLKAEFEKKHKKVANLEALKEQLAEMEQSFGDMLRQLPNKTEIAGLIVDISQTGLAAGLEFDLFKPGAEIQKEFYSELPIKLKVSGTYHQLGEFVSGVASLPRIVTTHDMKITGKGTDLTAEATAKTYRAKEEQEDS